MDIVETLAASWAELSNRNEDEHWNALRLDNEIERPILLAIDQEQVRHILVPADRRYYPTSDRSVLRVDVGEHLYTFVDGGAINGRYLDISCQAPSLNPQFDRVIESILERIGEGGDPSTQAIKAVESWRHLFSVLSVAPALSLEETYGAFAELLVLELLASSRVEFTVDWWTGPLGRPHDFELPDVSIEVKAISNEDASINIHGLEQLDSFQAKPLHLVVVKLIEDPQGITIGELLDRVVEDKPERFEIRRLAAAVGIHSSAEDQYRFVVESFTIIQVDDRFPRLVPGSIVGAPAEILSSVTYKIDLGGFEPPLIFSDYSKLKECLNELS